MTQKKPAKPRAQRTAKLRYRAGDWILTRDPDFDMAGDPALDVVESVDHDRRVVVTYYGQHISFEDIEEARRAEDVLPKVL